MDDISNAVFLCGHCSETPVFSHESRDIRFYSFPLSVRRLSGTRDTVNIMLRDSLLQSCPIQAGDRVAVSGELRSFNNKSGIGAKLVISVLARELNFSDQQDDNRVILNGTLCKEPVLRQTPLGREICDLILAVPRRYSRSDYIPVIVWGLQARSTARYPVGTKLSVQGRIQSRQYTKLIDGVPMERTAFELSAVEIIPA